MSGAFKFTPLRMHSPEDNLAAAISIIQTSIMAADTDVNAAVMFGNFHFRTDQLQVAVALLVALLAPVDDLQWEDEA